MIRKFWFVGLLTGVVLMAGCDKEAKTVKLETSMGDIVIELNEGGVRDAYESAEERKRLK